jgi:hypothetical protein
MKIPNAEYAVVDVEKLRKYSLNTEHEIGKHKAHVFSAVLGLTLADAEWLRNVLREKIKEVDAVAQPPSRFGDRYRADFILERQGREATVRSSWIILKGELVPHLTSCFVRRSEKAR